MQLQTCLFRALAVSALLTCAVAAGAQAPTAQDLVGTWRLTLTSPQGTHPATLAVREEAGGLAASISGEMGTTPVSVKSSDAGVHLSFTVDYQGQPLPIVLTGTVADGVLKGTVDYANGAEGGTFEGRKNPTGAAGSDASVTGTWTIEAGGRPGWSLELTQNGTAVTGMLRNADQGVAVPVKGTLDRSALELALTGEASGTITGTWDGTALKGTYQVDGNSGSWSATRNR